MNKVLDIWKEKPSTALLQTLKSLHFQNMKEQTQTNTNVTWIQHSDIFFPQQCSSTVCLIRIDGTAHWVYICLPKNIPVLAVAVGQNWGFQIHQDGRQQSWNALLCHTLLHPPPCFSFFPASLYLAMHWDFVAHLLRENPREETGLCVQRSNF